MDRQPPDEDAYSRVTNPERFAPLHDIARAIVDRLTAAYDVDRIDDGDVLRLVPRRDDAAPISIELTPFPGVRVRAGRWLDGPIPQCGCDACDEQLHDAERELRRLVDAVVAGGLTEGWNGERLSHAIEPPSGDSSSGWTLMEGRDLGPTGTYEWRPWRAR